MTHRGCFSATVWGGLSLLAGAAMTEGGVMEAIAYWPRGEMSNVLVGIVGAAASALLLVSGAAFCARRPFGRKTAIAGAIGMVPVHLVGWILGFLGVPGAFMGIAYPALLLLVLRARPGLGAPFSAEVGPGDNERPPESPRMRRRTVVSAC